MSQAIAAPQDGVKYTAERFFKRSVKRAMTKVTEKAAISQKPEHNDDIVLMPPPELPDPAAIDERADASRYLIQALDRIEQGLLEIDHVGEFLDRFIGGLQSALGCSEVGLVMHDPVGQLQACVERPLASPEQIIFVADTSVLYETFPDGIKPLWFDDAHQITHNSSLFSEWSEGYLLPVVESGVLVGVVRFSNPSIEIVQSDIDLEQLFRFIARFSTSLQRVEKIQQLSHLLHVDPVTRLSNRYGLLSELEREIGRTHRAGQSLSLVVLTIQGLSGYHNHSSRHVESMILSKVATQINASLRVTDGAARLDHTSFVIVLPNAPASSMPDVCWRYEKDLSGMRIDDSNGGFVEISVQIAWFSVLPNEEGMPTSELANRMLTVAIDAAENGRSGPIAAHF